MKRGGIERRLGLYYSEKISSDIKEEKRRRKRRRRGERRKRGRRSRSSMHY